MLILSILSTLALSFINKASKTAYDRRICLIMFKHNRERKEDGEGEGGREGERERAREREK